MNKKDYIKNVNNKKFLKLIREKNNIIGTQDDLYFENDDVTIGFNNKDIYDYLKEIKNIDLDEESDDFNENILKYYNIYEDDIDDYFLLQNRYEYIKQLED